MIVGSRNRKGDSPASNLSSQGHAISQDRSTWAKLSEGHRFLTAYKLS